MRERNGSVLQRDMDGLAQVLLGLDAGEFRAVQQRVVEVCDLEPVL